MNQKKRLGLNGSELSPIGLGPFSFSRAYCHADAAASSATLSRALELGCRLIDTADTYSTGDNEAWLGRMLQGRRHEVVLCTKIGLICDAAGKIIGAMVARITS